MIAVDGINVRRREKPEEGEEASVSCGSKT